MKGVKSLGAANCCFYKEGIIHPSIHFINVTDWGLFRTYLLVIDCTLFYTRQYQTLTACSHFSGSAAAVVWNRSNGIKPLSKEKVITDLIIELVGSSRSFFARCSVKHCIGRLCFIDAFYNCPFESECVFTSSRSIGRYADPWYIFFSTTWKLTATTAHKSIILFSRKGSVTENQNTEFLNIGT